MDFRDVVPKLIALHNAGAVPIPGVQATITPVVEPGNLDIGTLGKILKFYEDNKTLFGIILKFAQPFLDRFLHPAAHPELPPPPPPIVILPPPPVVVPPPAAGAAREIAQLLLRYFWINRKNTPWVEGGGRKLLDTPLFQAILAGDDPLQGGDRVCFDVTPVDQFGRKFVTGDAANVLMKGIEYEVLGGVGELQLQDPEGLGFDPTPVVFVPWEGGTVKPGFQGELGLIARYTNPQTGQEIKSNALPLLRIRPWA
jgi:hypothetical protein